MKVILKLWDKEFKTFGSDSGFFTNFGKASNLF